MGRGVSTTSSHQTGRFKYILKIETWADSVWNESVWRRGQDLNLHKRSRDTSALHWATSSPKEQMGFDCTDCREVTVRLLRPSWCIFFCVRLALSSSQMIEHASALLPLERISKPQNSFLQAFFYSRPVPLIATRCWRAAKPKSHISIFNIFLIKLHLLHGLNPWNRTKQISWNTNFLIRIDELVLLGSTHYCAYT